MATGIAMSDKVNDHLDSQAAALGLRTKDGLAHAILELALTNPTLNTQAAAMRVPGPSRRWAFDNRRTGPPGRRPRPPTPWRLQDEQCGGR
jgi:hypothetical protein